MPATAAPDAQAPPHRRSRTVRVLLVAAIVLVLALVAVTVLAVTTVRRSFPATEGTETVEGLTGEVQVLRDEHGIPQVYADTAEDLFFAQGYVQAQDRFYEMDVRRHVTAGRLSELFGRTTLDTDRVVRTLGWRRIAERELGRLDTTTLRYLEAFSAGVNAYIGDRSPGELSLEYTLLSLGGLDDLEIEPWVPADSVAWLKAMAWDLRGNMQDEIDRVLASTVVSRERVEQLFPAYPFDRHRPVVQGGAVVGGRFVAPTGRGAARPPALPTAARAALADARAATSAVPVLVGSGEGVGSNAWVVDGDHSETGAPILANDPHLAPTLPGIWYQMGLHCRTVGADCPFDVAGFTFAGFPGVVIGHNQDIAWGFTNLGPDVTDLYVEALEGRHYVHDGAWRRLRTREERIEVAGEDPVTLTVRSTRHGPLISDAAEAYADAAAAAPVPRGTRPLPDGTPEGGSVPDEVGVALAWTALRPARTADAVFALNRAGDWEEFRAATRLFAVPSQNIVYADREGHIGYQAPGRIPVRRPLHTGDWPVPGWDARYDWTGRTVPFAEMPRVLDPAEGFIATANQAPVGTGYLHDLGGDWDHGYRSQRIVELIEREGTLSVEDMASIQTDTHNGFAPVLVPHLLEVDVGSRYYQGGQRLLEDWDFAQPADSAAAAYFNAVWRNLLLHTFDELPEDVGIAGGSRWFEVVRGLLETPNDPWWDDAETDGVRESRDDMLRLAMRDARDELVQRQSRRPERWTWGHHHRLELENQTVGQSDVGAVAATVNRGPWELGGGTSVVLATGWDAREGYEVTWAPSMRMVVSMGDLDASTWVNLTGASGHAFSDHYTDQTELWARGETLPWAFGAEAVEDAATATLTLSPAGTTGSPTG